MKKTMSVLLMMMLSLSVLVGCESNQTPTKVVDTYFQSIQKSNTKEAQQLIKDTISTEVLNEDINKSTDDKKTSKKDDSTMDESLKTYLSKIDAKVLSEKVDKDKAKVKVEVKAPNYSELLLKVMEDSVASSLNGNDVSQAEVENSLLEKVKSSKAETRTGTINLTKKDNKWEINRDSDITNLLLGEADETESIMYSK